MDQSARPKALLRKVHETAKDYAIAAALGALFLGLLPGWLRCICLYVGALVFLASVIGTFVIDWRPRSRVEVAGKAVVISGCDSGFGHMLAQKLDDLGFQVFAGCLFPEGDGAQNLKKSASSRLHVVAMDVTKDESVQDSLIYVKSNLQDNVLWAVVCNAGINDGGEILWTGVDVIQKIIDVNTFGVVRVTKAFLPLIAKSKGRVVAVASAAGRYTYPGLVPYCMSKCAVVSFCEGLRLEMYRWGVQVVTVEPWMYKTNITNAERVADYIANTWKKAPAAIKDAFPPEYLGILTKKCYQALNFSVAKNPGEVVACLEEAVAAKSPKCAYMPGTILSRLTFWLYRKLPKSLADLIFSMFMPLG